jgi:formylglycine-generating enzyme required for sulfatase activity
MNQLHEKLIIEFLAKANIQKDATLIYNALKIAYPNCNLPVDKTFHRFINGETNNPRDTVLGFLAAFILETSEVDVTEAYQKDRLGEFYKTFVQQNEQATEDTTSGLGAQIANQNSKKERNRILLLWVLIGIIIAFMFGYFLSLNNKSKPIFTVPAPIMIEIKGGTFPYGDTFGDTDAEEDERPVRSITIDTFLIGQTEITFNLFDLYCDSKNITKREDLGWGRSDYPAIMLDWYEAIDFCNWLSVAQNFKPVYTTINDPENPIKKHIYSDFNNDGYRLPTEAEWEYAASFDSYKGIKYRFSGSDTADANILIFNFQEKPKKEYITYGKILHSKTVPVLKSGQNQNGLYGMTGNVAEWCHDYYHPHFYRDDKNLNNPVAEEIFNKDTSHVHVIRGGHWDEILMHVRATYRESSPANCRSEVFGFRVVRRSQ